MYNIHQIKYEITSNKISNDYRGILISDLHYNLTLNKHKLTNYVNKINKLNPDFVFLVGDIVGENTSLDEMNECFEILGNLETKYGVFYTYGNHDKNNYRNNKTYTLSDLDVALSKNNIIVLKEKSYKINDELVIIGRDQNSRKNLKNIPVQAGFKIVLDHIPREYQIYKQNNIDLVLSGHTHAGQIFPVRILEEVFKTSDMIYGIKREKNTTFIVTSGISGWGIPFRTDGNSEYVIIDIKKYKV